MLRGFQQSNFLSQTVNSTRFAGRKNRCTNSIQLNLQNGTNLYQKRFIAHHFDKTLYNNAHASREKHQQQFYLGKQKKSFLPQLRNQSNAKKPDFDFEGNQYKNREYDEEKKLFLKEFEKAKKEDKEDEDIEDIDEETDYFYMTPFVGFGVIAMVEIWNLYRAGKFSNLKKKKEEEVKLTPEEEKLWSRNTVAILKKLPLSFISYYWGAVTRAEIPVWARKFIYGNFAKMYDCNLEEMTEPLDNYNNFAEFFTRKLKPGVRTIDPTADLVSPADGRVLHFGEIKENSLEQVKGITYNLSAFVGSNFHNLRRRNDTSKQAAQNKLYHCIIYLAPGDYHGFHSPTDWKITDRRHFPGHLFPVAPWAVERVRGLFAINERVVLAGHWKHGFFSFTPVGATNVGSIQLHFDDVKTNVRPRPTDRYYDKLYNSPVPAEKGDGLGFFYMGSTVVLIFESPGFIFDISQGQKIKLGEKLGRVVPASEIVDTSKPRFKKVYK